jgi:hypothetical protein
MLPCPCAHTYTHINSVAFSPQANNTDWATVTSRQILVPTFVDRGVSCGQRSGTPMAIILNFLGWSCYFFFQVAPLLSSRGWVDPVPDPLLLRKSSSTKNRAWDLSVYSQELWPLDDRGACTASCLPIPKIILLQIKFCPPANQLLFSDIHDS